MRAANIFWVALGSMALLGAAGASLAAPPAAAIASGGDWNGAYRHVREHSLEHALHVIERSTGGRVLEIRLLHRHGPGFEAVVAKNHELINVRVHDVSDEVTRIAVTETPRWMLDWRLKADMASVREEKLSPAQAISRAEKDTGAPAVDVSIAKPLSGHDGVLAYDVEVVKDGMPERVAIDARTGQLIADPQAVLGPWTPERLAQQDTTHRG